MCDTQISEDEMVQLMEDSVDGNFIACTFGPPGVYLRNVPENAFAFERLEQIRATELRREI